MLGTLVKIAKEMIAYEVKLKGTSQEIVELNRLCENPTKGKDETKVLVLDIDKVITRLEDYKDEERYKYLFARSTGMQAIGPSWVLDFSKKGKIKEDIIRIGLKQVRTALNLLSKDLTNGDSNWTESCLNVLTENEERILKRAANSELGKRLLFTIEFDGRKPGEIRNLCSAFIRKRLFGGTRAQYIGDSFCGVCRAKTKVRPSIPFDNFFTVEKRGFSPMAIEGESWKYAPICEKCTRLLYISKDFLNDHLQTRVAGTHAYLIPTLEPGASRIRASFIQYLWEFQERSQKRIIPKVEDFPEVESKKKRKSELPNLLRDLIEGSEQWKDHPPFRSASLVFYQPGRKFLFLHTTSDILPRHLREANERIRSLRATLAKGVLGDIGRYKVKILSGDFNFVNDAWTWPKSKRDKTKTSGTLILNPMLIVEAILLQKRQPKSVFWSDVDSILRAIYHKTISRDNKLTVRQALSNRITLLWVIWTLLYEKTEGDKTMLTTEENIKDQGFGNLSLDFWENFFASKKMLNSYAKKAVFLIGVIFGVIEWRQRKERQSRQAGEMPILSRLRGLTLTHQDIISLFPELKLKLRQFSFAFRSAREIEAVAGGYLTNAESLSDAEARFFFSLGWSLYWHTYSLVRDQIGAEEEEVETVHTESAEETSQK